MQPNYHRLYIAPSTRSTIAAHSTPPPSHRPPPFRRTWKIVRSEIALDVEPPTSNDGACTIVSAPHYASKTASPSTSLVTGDKPYRHALTPYETPCVVWLDWRGHHARFSCIYNTATDSYSRFVIEKASIDHPAPVACWRVDIRFYQGLKCAGWRVRDENGERYMVVNIELDEGWGMRRGKAYGKLMAAGVRDEDVVMTEEEGAELGCLVGLKTVEEQREMVERAREIVRLERALQQIRDRMKMAREEAQRLGDELADEEERHEGRKEEQEKFLQEDKERDTEVQEDEKEPREEEKKKKRQGRTKFHFPPSAHARALERRYCL